MISAVNAVRAARQNRVVILEAVQRAGAISRARLVTTTGLTPATITNAVRELIELRLVRSTGQLASRKTATAGAPSELLALDGSWHRVLSVHQGVSLIRLGLHDITGAVLTSRELAARPRESAHGTVRRVSRALHELLRIQAVSREQIRGVGVGAVGLVDPETGTVRAAPNLGWADVPLQALLEDSLGWPVMVRNNVHAMAAGEVRFAGVPEGDAVYVYVGTGIGSGIIVRGRVHDGAHGAAGEIGHLIVAGGGPCTCGKLGCLETIAAEPAIVGQATSLASGNWSPGAHKPSVMRLVELALAGDTRARAVLADVAESLGLALAQVVEIIDPGAVILNGVIVAAGDLFLGPLAAALHRSAFVVRGRSVAVRAACFGRQAGMIGAATLALDEFIYQPRADLFGQRAANRRVKAWARPA
ncbi:MAG: ROK family protein [Chloroflexota bacterium]|nr:ROK family protein [Chloroflexota bacterium]